MPTLTTAAIILLGVIAVVGLVRSTSHPRWLHKSKAQNRRLVDFAHQIENLALTRVYLRNSVRLQLLSTATEILVPTRRFRWLIRFGFAYRKPRAAIVRFSRNSSVQFASMNRDFIERQLHEYGAFFDAIESKPLTERQRIACIVAEDNNLVIAGAGTGKTSTMVGKAGYLIESRQSAPGEILMIAYGRKAADELNERLKERLKERPDGNVEDQWMPRVSTFHAFGLHVLANVDKTKPAVSQLAENELKMRKFIDQTVERLLLEPAFRRDYLDYQTFFRFPARTVHDFTSLEDYHTYVQTTRFATLRGERVQSFGELLIANYLTRNSVKYQYEQPYEHPTSDLDHRQYKPDFFLPDYGIYIEHFALDKDGKAPEYFRKPHGSTYEDGVEWKRLLHAEKQTDLIETYSYLQSEGRLLGYLEEQLKLRDVELTWKTDEEVLSILQNEHSVSDFSGLACDFVQLFKQTTCTFEALRTAVQGGKDENRFQLLLKLFEPVYTAYEDHLASHGEIDFADMIRRATTYIQEGKYRSEYKHVLIDEFQDISPARSDLVRSLRSANPDVSLFVVGDDWQSIYRFTGSHLGIMTNFRDEYGRTAETKLDKTFRFNDRIGQTASTFIQRNPQQIKKEIESTTQSIVPEISMVRVSTNSEGIRLALQAIHRRTRSNEKTETRVLVLARYRYVYEELMTPDNLRTQQSEFPGVTVDFNTIHGAKGKESDFVVVLGLLHDEFPVEKPVDDILELLLPEKESFPFAEERRLFYVALTRARNRVYLVYNPLDPSDFVEELLGSDYEVCRDEFHPTLVLPDVAPVKCPKCVRGNLRVRQGPKGQFVGCSGYPYCEYVEKVCPFCEKGVLRTDGAKRVCTNQACRKEIPVCPICGGYLLIRQGQYGPFWGCINYRGRDRFSCLYTKSVQPKSR